MQRNLLILAIFALATVFLPTAARAYPEFQTFVQKNSGRPVNCAMCHVHSDGPEGTAGGQMGSLNAEEMSRLALARLAFTPGQDIDSPVLNDFGDYIIRALGKTTFLELRSNPVLLAEALGNTNDLDKDGIPDSREYLDGTHPLLSTHGNPWLLFVNNLVRNRFHIIMITIATLAGLYGLNHLVRGLAARLETPSTSVTHKISLRRDQVEQ